MFKEGYIKVKPYEKLPYIGQVVKIKEKYWVIREIQKLEWDGIKLVVYIIIQEIKEELDFEKEFRKTKKEKFEVIEFKSVT